jgi:hypothetical protein
MGEHRAFRAAGRARGVEQPGEIVGRTGNERDRIGADEPLPVGAAERDQPVESLRRVRRDRGRNIGGGEADAGARLGDDVAELAPVQPGVRRHRDQAAVPHRVERIEIVGRILRRDHDPVARHEPACVAQRAREPRHPLREGPVASDHARAVTDGSGPGMRAPGALEPQSDVHGRIFMGGYSLAPRRARGERTRISRVKPCRR